MYLFSLKISNQGDSLAFAVLLLKKNLKWQSDYVLLFVMNISVIQSIERMKTVELLTSNTIVFLLPLLAWFKSSDMQRLNFAASEYNWNVSASCPKQASPPAFFCLACLMFC